MSKEKGGKAGVDKIRGLLADAVNPYEAHIVGPEEQLQKSLIVADDEASRIAGVGGFSHDIGDTFFAQRLFCFPGAGTLGDCVNPEWQNPGEGGFVFQIESMAHGDAGLLHGSGGQGRKSNHISCGIDVRNIRLVMFIHLQ